MLIVVSGMVRAYIISTDGEEKTIALYGKKDAFPLSVAIGQANSALFYYEALSDARILVISTADFAKEIESNHDASQALVSLVGREYTGLMLRMTAMSQSRTLEKLAHTFYFLTVRYGLERPNGWYQIDVKLNQSMLGNLIGQTRENTARNLKDLVSKGLVEYKSSSYSVHREKLLAYIGEDSFRDIEQ